VPLTTPPRYAAQARPGIRANPHLWCGLLPGSVLEGV